MARPINVSERIVDKFSLPISEDELVAMTSQLRGAAAAIRSTMLTSKEMSEKKREYEKTWSSFEDAFSKISSVYSKIAFGLSIMQEIKSLASQSGAAVMRERDSYASVLVRPSHEKVALSRGPTLKVPKSISISVRSRASELDKFADASSTKEALFKAFRPSSVNLKVSALTMVSHDKSVRIKAVEVDIEAMRKSESLKDAGLEISVNEKQNPRLLVSNVQREATPEVIVEEIGRDIGHRLGDE